MKKHSHCLACIVLAAGLTGSGAFAQYENHRDSEELEAQDDDWFDVNDEWG